MKINQLFKDKVPEGVATGVAECFGLRSMADGATFSKEDLSRLRTREHLQSLADQLRLYYLPCKARIYLQLHNDQSCITLLRQVLRLHGYSVKSTQRYANQKKTTFYHVADETSCGKNVKLTNELVRIDFE